MFSPIWGDLGTFRVCLGLFRYVCGYLYIYYLVAIEIKAQLSLTTPQNIVIFMVKIKKEKIMASNGTTTVDDLKSKRRELESQIERLKDILMAIDKTIDIFVNEQVPMVEILTSTGNGKAMGPTGALKYLFETFPTKKWYPRQLADRLQEMKDIGEVETDSNNLMWTVHGLLRVFVEKEYLEKHGMKRKKWYRKLQNSHM